MSGDPRERRPSEVRAGDSVFRPYVLTLGRTVSESGGDLPLEALVVSANGGEPSKRRLSRECRQIIKTCVEPTSIAEIAAHLSVPIGVARVLVTDMSAQGELIVHKTAEVHDEGLMRRLIDGIQDL